MASNAADAIASLINSPAETAPRTGHAVQMEQPFDGAARKALEATGLLTAEEVTLIIGHRKRNASRAAIAASLENTALLPTAEKPAERELTAVERNLRPPPSPGVEKRAAVAEAEDRLSDTLAKMALAPSNARAPAVLDERVRRALVVHLLDDAAAHAAVRELERHGRSNF